jgi:hypothetical protein
VGGGNKALGHGIVKTRKNKRQLGVFGIAAAPPWPLVYQ